MAGVLFIVMPFGALEAPQVGVSTMKSQLLSLGIPCDIAYLNFPFAEALGHDAYQEIINYAGTLFVGEWLFARSLFPEEIDHQGYIREILMKGGGLGPSEVDRILGWTHLVEDFLESCLENIDWERYDIVGFTSMFEQNLASLALAKRVKQRFPDKVLVMGGANCAGAMGRQLHQAFSFLDIVFTGEADFVFPELVRRLGQGIPFQNGLRGFVFRRQGDSVDTGQSPLIRNLDALPYPNYDDFLQQLGWSGVKPKQKLQMVIETSRGCWWGEKNHCRFCGLNEHELPYRSKSPERALDEIFHVAARYGIGEVMPVDNILNLDYFKTLLPELKRRKSSIRLFYETKANLKKEQIQLLRDAGVTRIQPGIEAFSANVLKLMHKGVSPLQNVQLLKWCRQYQVDVAWNLLYGFPGENLQDYRDTFKIVQAISHLHPPMAYGYVGLHRFSPIFHAPEQFKLRRIRPLAAYKYLYPFPEAVLENLAYFFDFDFDGKEKTEYWFHPIKLEVERWQQMTEHSRLEAIQRGRDPMVVRDTRPRRARGEYRFNRLEAALVEFCDEPRTFPQIHQFLATMTGDLGADESRLRGFLDWQVEHRLMLRMEERYLNLILLEPSQAQPAGAFWTRQPGIPSEREARN